MGSDDAILIRDGDQILGRLSGLSPRSDPMESVSTPVIPVFVSFWSPLHPHYITTADTFVFRNITLTLPEMSGASTLPGTGNPESPPRNRFPATFTETAATPSPLEEPIPTAVSSSALPVARRQRPARFSRKWLPPEIFWKRISRVLVQISIA